MNNIKFWIEQKPFYDGFGIHISSRPNESIGRAIAKPIEFEVIDQNVIENPPALNVTREEAQLLIDALWDAGLRPSNGLGSAGQMVATEKHLKDMRAIVSKKLGIDL